MDRDLAIGMHGRFPLGVVLATTVLSVLCCVVLIFNPVEPSEQVLRTSTCAGKGAPAAAECLRRRAGEP